MAMHAMVFRYALRGISVSAHGDTWEDVFAQLERKQVAS